MDKHYLNLSYILSFLKAKWHHTVKKVAMYSIMTPVITQKNWTASYKNVCAISFAVLNIPSLMFFFISYNSYISQIEF